MTRPVWLEKDVDPSTEKVIWPILYRENFNALALHAIHEFLNLILRNGINPGLREKNEEARVINSRSRDG